MPSNRPNAPPSQAAAGPDAQPPRALLRAARRLLAPLVRLGLAHGLTFPAFSELLKRVYLDVAERELMSDERPASASRLSVATGLHRKDIRRLRGPAPRHTPPTSVSLGARAIARWTEPPWCDARGRPRPLPRAADPAGAGFEDLIASVSTDVRPRAVLDEWLRLGLVEIDADDRVVLREAAFVPREGFDEKAHFLGRNVADHLAAAAHNLAGGPPQLERSVHYQELSEASVAELQQLASELGMQTLQTLNRRARELQRRDARRSADAGHRINFGVYFHRDIETPDEEAGDDSQ